MTELSKPRVAVLGGGSFGTVIANLAAGNGCESTLWLRDADLVEEMAASHENTRYLPGFTLDERLRFSNDLAEAVVEAKRRASKSDFTGQRRVWVWRYFFRPFPSSRDGGEPWLALGCR